MTKNKDIYLIGEVWEGGLFSIENVVNELKDMPKDLETITLHINSPGGSVYEGFGIVDMLRKANKKIKVSLSGFCASIATYVACALADNKDDITASEHTKWLIHYPMSGTWGTAEELEKNAQVLRDIENDAIKVYQKVTGLSEEDLRELMKEDSEITAAKAVELGFIGKIQDEYKAIANVNFKKSDMTNTKEINEKLQKTEGMLSKIMGLLSGKKNLSVQDANGTVIDFPDVKEGEAADIGATAKVGDSPANGAYVMPDGETWVFENSKLKEKKPNEESVEITNLKKEVEDLKKERDTLKASVTEKEGVITSLKTSMDEFKDEMASIKALVTTEPKAEPKPQRQEPSQGSGGKVRRSYKPKE